MQTQSLVLQIQQIWIKFNFHTFQDESIDTANVRTSSEVAEPTLSWPTEGARVYEADTSSARCSAARQERHLAVNGGLTAGIPAAQGCRVNTLESRGGFKRPPPARVHKRARGEPPGSDGGAISCLEKYRHSTTSPESIEERTTTSTTTRTTSTSSSTSISEQTSDYRTDPSAIKPDPCAIGSLVQLPPHPRSDYTHAGTLTGTCERPTKLRESSAKWKNVNNRLFVNKRCSQTFYHYPYYYQSYFTICEK